MKKATLKDLKLDPRNANKHTQFGTGLLENSIRENGFGRSILVSNDNVVIAGNGTAESGAAIGMEDVEIVETDGKKLIVVKRTDIKSGTAEFEKMALADNLVATKNIAFDPEIVQGIVEDFPETKPWAAIILEEPEERPIVDKDRAGLVEVKFVMTGTQAAKLKQALKMAKTVFKIGKSEQANGTAMFQVSKYFVDKKGK